MPEDAPIAKQIEATRDLLRQTRAGLALWSVTEDSAVFTSVRTRAIAVLDRVDEPPRVRLRFSILGQTDNDTIIEQAKPQPKEPRLRTLDKILTALWREVSPQAGQHLSAADLFLLDGSDVG
jgi:hypothetical protein